MIIDAPNSQAQIEAIGNTAQVELIDVYTHHYFIHSAQVIPEIVEV